LDRIIKQEDILLGEELFRDLDSDALQWLLELLCPSRTSHVDSLLLAGIGVMAKLEALLALLSSWCLCAGRSSREARSLGRAIVKRHVGLVEIGMDEKAGQACQSRMQR